MERRLAAILAADVVGYSRMVRADEEGTIVALRAVRDDLIVPKIAEHRGRIVKTMGDGFLIEFASVVDAVACGVEIQNEMAVRGADIAEAERIVFRIGVNLGDVVIEADDIHGDGVNVAARLETLSDPGGMCISNSVHEQVRDRLSLQFADFGEQRVKNIDRPIRAWRWSLDGSLTEQTGQADLPRAPLYKPSIAVLPFTNMSDDPDQDYFVDGMVEDIITELSRSKSLMVIARNSTFIYKGRAIDVRQVAQELGVRYVLEGSVRKAGNRIRVTGQLVDGDTGTHLWADRYDGNLEDIFELQDRMTLEVVGAIEPALRQAEIERSRRKPPDNLIAYDFYMRSLPHVYAFTPEDNTLATDLLDRAVELDGRLAEALAYAAWCREQRIVRGWPNTRPDDLEKGVALAHAAIATESENANAIATAGFVLGMLGREYDVALRALQRALDLNPSAGMVSMFAGMANIFMGDLDVALSCLERARSLSPSDPQANFFLTGISFVHLFSHRYEEAVDFANRALGVNAEWDTTYWVLGPALAYLGRDAEAREAVAKLMSLAPHATVSGFRELAPVRDPDRLEIMLEGMRLAGVPE